jgi:hypothetical protein
MKTKLLYSILISAFLFSNIKAQITVTNTDVITIGHQTLEAHDTMPLSGIFPGPAGTNQIWNFSTLHNHTYDTSLFVDPATTPYSSNFLASTIAYIQNTPTNKNNGTAYLENNTTGLYFNGIAAYVHDSANHIIKEYITPFSKAMQWPSSYGTNYADNYVINGKCKFDRFGNTVDSIRIKNTIASVCNIDAWGTMTTPLNTFPTLRQKRSINEIDSTWAHLISPSSWVYLGDSTFTKDSYTWWTNTAGIGVPIVEMDYNSTTLVASKVKWLFAMPTLGILEQVNAFGFAAYPNPANNYITIQVKENMFYSISVYDITGKEIKLNKETQNFTTTLNTETLDSGLYFVVLADKQGNRSTTKISIVH